MEWKAKDYDRIMGKTTIRRQAARPARKPEPTADELLAQVWDAKRRDVGLADFRMPGAEPAQAPARTVGGMVTRQSDHAGRLKAGVGGSAGIPERIEYIGELRDMIRGLREGNEMGFVDQDTIDHLEARAAEQSAFVSWHQGIYDELRKRVGRDYMTETQRGRDELGRELSRSQRGWDWFVNEWADRGASAILLRNQASQLVALGWLEQKDIADLSFVPPDCPEMDAIKAKGHAEWDRYLAGRAVILEKVSEYAPKRKRHPISAQEARLTAEQVWCLSNCQKGTETGLVEWTTALCQKDLLATPFVLQLRNLITDILRPQRTMIG